MRVLLESPQEMKGRRAARKCIIRKDPRHLLLLMLVIESLLGENFILNFPSYTDLADIGTIF